jgi:hypothetical protein
MDYSFPELGSEGRSTNRANRLLIDYSFTELGSEVGVGAVGVVETMVVVRWAIRELLVARVGHLLLK